MSDQLELVDQVERVASAMWTARSPGFSWGIQPEPVKYEYRRMAEAAIEAMRGGNPR